MKKLKKLDMLANQKVPYYKKFLYILNITKVPPRLFRCIWQCAASQILTHNTKFWREEIWQITRVHQNFLLQKIKYIFGTRELNSVDNVIHL